MDPGQLFRDNLSLVEQVVDGVCRRRRVYGADAEDFASTVKIALIENDYEILRRWERRSSLATYLTIIAERMLFDQRAQERGRWHPSAEAQRMGKAGVLLETAVRRDGRPLEEAVLLVQSAEPLLTRADVESMLARLPDRRPRPLPAPIEAAADDAAAPETSESRVLESEARKLSGIAARVVREAMSRFDLEDRMLVRMRFRGGMKISDISRMTRWPQRPLYRRLEDLVSRLRRALHAAGISDRNAGDLLAAAEKEDLDFGFMENDDDRQTIHSEEPRRADSP